MPKVWKVIARQSTSVWTRSGLAVFIDIQAIIDTHSGDTTGTAFRPGVIVALATVGQTRSMYVLANPDELQRAGQALRILEGEGVVFDRVFSSRSNLAKDSADVGVISADTHVLVGTGTVWPSDRPEGFRFVDVLVGGWPAVAESLTQENRTAEFTRRTTETQIKVQLNLDGVGEAAVQTGVGFFDHMLQQLVRHSRVDLTLTVEGDLHVDEHHTIEDTAIALGTAFGQALGDKKGLERYGFVLPMDDALARVALDWSGRSWLVWDVAFTREKIGDMPTEMFYHFFKSFADAAACNLNIACAGENEHHKIEAIFKAVGRCVRQSKRRRPHDMQVPSTKGVL